MPRVLMTPARQMIKMCVAGAAAGVLMVGIAACGSTPDPEVSPAPSLSTSPSISAAEADAAARALTAYEGYVRAYTAAGAAADFKSPELRKYIADPLLGDTVYFLSQLNKNGLVRVGEPVSDPRVTSIKIDAPPRTVEIEDCVDTRDFTVVHKDTGEPATQASPGPDTRRTTVAEVVLFDDGRWLVRKITVGQDDTC